MNRLLATSAIALFLVSGAAYAQQTSSSDAGAASNAQQGQGQIQTQGSITNGGSSANNGGQQTTVGPQTSTSNAASNAGANSIQGQSQGNNNSNGGVSVGPQTTSIGDTTSRSNSSANASDVSVSRATGGNAQGGNSSAQASNAATNAGNAQNITFNQSVPTHTTADVKTVAQVTAPPLTTTLTDTCMGSSSMSGTGMGWGLSIGSTWEDHNCNRRLYAREVASLTGDREAARAILCQDADVQKAFAAVGRPCPGTEGYTQRPPEAFVPPPPPPPPAPPPINIYSAPPPPPPTEGAAEQAQPAGTMAPIPNPEPKAPRN